jgi:hypothetical protein
MLKSRRNRLEKTLAWAESIGGSRPAASQSQNPGPAGCGLSRRAAFKPMVWGPRQAGFDFNNAAPLAPMGSIHLLERSSSSVARPGPGMARPPVAGVA